VVSLYDLSMDRMENIVSNSSYIVARVSVVAEMCLTCRSLTVTVSLTSLFRSFCCCFTYAQRALFTESKRSLHMDVIPVNLAICKLKSAFIALEIFAYNSIWEVFYKTLWVNSDLYSQ
jgi:hypothetical protein